MDVCELDPVARGAFDARGGRVAFGREVWPELPLGTALPRDAFVLNPRPRGFGVPPPRAAGCCVLPRPLPREGAPRTDDIVAFVGIASNELHVS